MDLTDWLLLAILIVIVGPTALDIADDLLAAVAHALERLSMAQNVIGRLMWWALPWRCQHVAEWRVGGAQFIEQCAGGRMWTSPHCPRHAEGVHPPIDYGSHHVEGAACTQCGLAIEIIERAITGAIRRPEIVDARYEEGANAGYWLERLPLNCPGQLTDETPILKEDYQ